MFFEKKVALITGASRGIGRAIGEVLSESNVFVIGTATNKLGVEIINNYLNNNGYGIQLNVSDKNLISDFFKKIYSKFNKVDIIINNAGIKNDNLIVRMKETEWQSVLNINLTSIYRISKIAIKKMIKNRYGRIVNISSIIGYTGNIGQANYAATKAGLIAFSKSLAREVAIFGITVNTIAPGFITTDMTKQLTDKQCRNILSQIPMKRFGNPKEVANVVAFLISDQASYITGETIHINGGMYML